MPKHQNEHSSKQAHFCRYAMDYCGAALAPNEQPRAHHGLVCGAIGRPLSALTAESLLLTPSDSISYVVLSGLALETSYVHGVKWPFPTNTGIYHSLKFPCRCKDAFAAGVHLLARTLFCWTFWETPLCAPTPLPIWFYCHQIWLLLLLCSSHDKKLAWQEGYKMLQCHTPQYWVFLCAPEKKDKTMMRQWKTENFMVALLKLNFYKFTCTHWAKKRQDLALGHIQIKTEWVRFMSLKP